MYANQLINEAEVQKTWGPIIEEATGVTEKSKLSWMSKYCHYHNLNESVYNTVHLNPNMNVQSMGNATLPGNPGSMNDFPSQKTGSGDLLEPLKKKKKKKKKLLSFTKFLTSQLTDK